ncbi:YitT family protein [Desulfofalx alkaliphila]|uniref:YitT family protein n=1 Tax=Desulfofalx alkaliphila TaxID=105483 RepID=UPI0004E2672A|nr:YitT family protein [Desulfofalx alkaliphila]
MLRAISGYIGVLTGVIILTLGLNLFLVPNKIASGGVSGIAIILHHLVKAPVGVAMLAMNLPLFIFGVIRLGRHTGYRTLFGTVALAVLVDASAPFLPVPTENLLLASIYGGLLVGLGIGLVFRNKGTTGGTDLAAAILRSYTGRNIGQLVFMLDALVVLSAGLAFRSWELPLYALITLFIVARVIDLVQEGFSYAKAFIIITNQPQAMADTILKEMGRGATAWPARGMFMGSNRQVLLSVVHRSEVSKFKEIVHRADHRAFMILADVHEVIGEGFSKMTVK